MKLRRVAPEYFPCGLCGQQQGNACTVILTGRLTDYPHSDRLAKAWGANRVLRDIEHDLNKVHLIQEEEGES